MNGLGITRNFDNSLPDCDDYRDVALELHIDAELPEAVASNIKTLADSRNRENIRYFEAKSRHEKDLARHAVNNYEAELAGVLETIAALLGLEPSLTIGPDMLIHAVTLSKGAARG